MSVQMHWVSQKRENWVLRSNPDLKMYRVTLHEEPGDRFTIVFDCYAEDADHAAEQAESAYPGCDVINCTHLDGLRSIWLAA